MSKICTSIEQSKKLIELGIDVNTADICWSIDIPDLPTLLAYPITDCDNWENKIPAWSLTALSEFILPYIADDDGNNYKFYLSKDGLDRWIAYYKSDDVSIHICEESYNMIDVILEMVCWLKENGKI
jgi:hypothetical protein